MLVSVFVYVSVFRSQQCSCDMIDREEFTTESMSAKPRTAVNEPILYGDGGVLMLGAINFMKKR